jgi:hypothetical protein
VTGLNPLEGEPSELASYWAAGRPKAVGTISEIIGSRTGERLGLSWVDSDSDGGSPILKYTLVEVVENTPDEVVYYGGALEIVLDNLKSGRKYTYRCKATNLVGDGPWSDQYTFIMVDKPSEPLNLRVILFDDTQVKIAWNQPLRNGGQALSGFRVYRQDCTDAISTFELL